jgi:hypothetical protein
VRAALWPPEFLTRVFASMAGTLQVSRALAGPRLADEIEQGIQNALALLGTGEQDS